MFQKLGPVTIKVSDFRIIEKAYEEWLRERVREDGWDKWQRELLMDRDSLEFYATINVWWEFEGREWWIKKGGKLPESLEKLDQMLGTERNASPNN